MPLPFTISGLRQRPEFFDGKIASRSVLTAPICVRGWTVPAFTKDWAGLRSNGTSGNII
jgi:hypothetical protein